MKLSGEEITWVFKVLRQVDFLSAYSSGELEDLIERLDKKTFPENTVIIEEGETGKFFFVIRTGQVSITVKKKKQDKLISSLIDGDYFGEMSLLTGMPCVATVKTVVETEIFSIYPDDFRLILLRNPELVRSMSKVISTRRNELEQELGIEIPETENLLDKINEYLQLDQ